LLAKEEPFWINLVHWLCYFGAHLFFYSPCLYYVVELKQLLLWHEISSWLGTGQQELFIKRQYLSSGEKNV
jgi:hypothetical protein